MKLIAALLLIVASAAAQTATLMSWGCGTIIAVTPGNPTILTCNTPHGWDTGKTLAVQLYGATGAYGALNTTAGNYGWLRQSVQAGDTTLLIGRQDLQVKGEQITVDAGPLQEVFTVTDKVGYTVTITPAASVYHSTAGFLRLNSSRVNFRMATAVDATHLSIPVNTTGAGVWSGTMLMRRATPGGNLYGRQNYGSGLEEGVANGALTVPNPAPADPTNPADVSAGYATGWTISFSAASTITNIVVSGTTTTISFPSPFPYLTTSAVGGVIYVKGAPDNHLNVIYVIQSVAGDLKSVTVATPVGVANGTYGLNFDGASIPSQAPFYLDWMPEDSAGAWSYPNGSMQSEIESGTFDPQMNRITLWSRLSGLSYQRPYNSSDGTINFGSYVKGAYTDGSGSPYNVAQEGNHFYHQLNPNIYDGVWVKTEVTTHPTYQRSCPGYFTNDPTWNGWTGGCLGFAGDRHYFDALNRFYYVYSGGFSSTVGKSVSIAPITLSKRTAEPDSTIGNVMALWAPARYTQSTGCGAPGPACTGTLGKGPGYEVTWTVPTYSVSGQMPSYEVRRGATSLKVAGFSTGLCNDGTTTCTAGNGDIISPTTATGTSGMWASSDTSVTQPAVQYVAIRPTFPVWSTTGSGVSPILVYTHDSTDMAVGDHVTIAGVTGNTAANGTAVAIAAVNPEKHFYRWDTLGQWITSIVNSNPVVIGTQFAHGLATGDLVRVDVIAGDLPGYYNVTVIDSTHVSLNGKTSTTSDASSWGKLRTAGELVQIVATGGSCVATTAHAHGLQVGQPIAVSDTGEAHLDVVDGAPITAATSTTLTFGCSGTVDGTYNIDSAANAPGYYQRQYPSIRAYSSVAIAGTGSGAYTSGGTLVSTESTKNFYEVVIVPYGINLLLSPSSLSYAAIINGAAPASQTVTLTTAGTATLDQFAATCDQTWCSVSPSSGTAAPATVTASVNPVGLGLGAHTAQLCVTSTTTGVNNSPTCSSVSLSITGAPAGITFSGVSVVR